MSAAAGLKYIGTRPVRPDGLEKVTGRANFGADHALPGMLFGKVVRSPHAHARIKSIDTGAAEAMPGVLAVVTAADFPDRTQMSWRRKGFNDNLLASDKVLYHGHAVAAVAATSNRAAEAAAAAVVVDYDVLDAVTDALAAMAPDAPVLHDDLFTDGLPETPETPSNLVKKQVISKGDVEAAFAAADVIVERTVLDDIKSPHNVCHRHWLTIVPTGVFTQLVSHPAVVVCNLHMFGEPTVIRCQLILRKTHQGVVYPGAQSP